MSKPTVGRLMALERLLGEDAIMLPQYKKHGGFGIFLAKSLNRPFQFERNDTAYTKSLDFLPVQWKYANLKQVGGNTIVWNQQCGTLNREYDEVVGGTLCWNQLLGNTETTWALIRVSTKTYSDGVYTLKVSNTSGNCGMNVANFFEPTHKYYITAKFNVPHATTCLFGPQSGSAKINEQISSTNTYVEFSSVVQQIASVSGRDPLVIYIKSDATGYAVGDAFQIKDLMVIDLTQMFGSAIADHIYALEQANAGAGVAWFRKLFPKDYYAYNAGTLMSVNASSHDTVGFNQWDEQWESGIYRTVDGQKNMGETRIRSKNPIPVFPNTTYYFEAPTSYGNINICYYDANNTFISSAMGKINTTFTTPAGCHYIAWNNSTNDVTSYGNDICINLSWSGYRNGEYEAYEKNSYPLDSTLTLRGIPKLDASNNLYYDGDTYASDGTVTRRYGIVDLGTLTWTYRSDSAIFYAAVTGLKADTTINAVCVSYPYGGSKGLTSSSFDDKTLYNRNGNADIIIKDSGYTDAATFTTAMSGVYLVYELATPTTETATAFTSPQVCDDFGTEEYIDYAESQGTRDVSIPVGHSTAYKYGTATATLHSDSTPYVFRETGGAGASSVTLTSGHKYYTKIAGTASVVTGAGQSVSVTRSKDMVIDLTVMFGTGNEPTTTAQFRAMFPDEYYAYDAGSLLSAGVTDVVSKDADSVTLDSYAIPAAVQALTGYGWSAGDVYNYVDFADKKFVQAVGSRAYASGDEADASVITDGTTTYYALDTPVETDVSAYLTDDNTLDVESGGTLTFENQHDGQYDIPVPTKIEYARRV